MKSKGPKEEGGREGGRQGNDIYGMGVLDAFLSILLIFLLIFS